MQSTGQTSTHELSLVPMHGSAMTYAICVRYSLSVGSDPPVEGRNAAIISVSDRLLGAARRQPLSCAHGDHLAHAGPARQATGREAGDRPAPRAARPVPDRALPGPDGRPEPAFRPL